MAFDLLGHNYEMNMIKALFYDNHSLGVKTLAATIILSIPSYTALYEYAFRKRPQKSVQIKIPAPVDPELRASTRQV